jgi:hypothetical protein
VSKVFWSFILLGIVAFVPYISWVNPTAGTAFLRNYHSTSRAIGEIFLDNPRALVVIVFKFLGFVATVTLVPTIVTLLVLLPISYFALRRAERLLRWGRTARAAVTTVSGPPTRSDWKFNLEFHDDAGSLVQTWTTGSGPRFSLDQVLTVLYDPENPQIFLPYPVPGYQVRGPES